MKNLFLLMLLFSVLSCSDTNEQSAVVACTQEAGVTIANKNPHVIAFGLGLALMPEDLYWNAKKVGDILTVRSQNTANGGSTSYLEYKFLCTSGTCPRPLTIKSYSTWGNDHIIIDVNNSTTTTPNSGTIVDFELPIGTLLLQEYVPGNRFVARVQTEVIQNNGLPTFYDKKMWIDLTNL